MKHGSLISPDEGSFGFGASKSMFEATSAGHQSGETVTVPDAELLFNGEFKRAGDDLKIIGQDGKSFLVEDYFKKDKHPTLLSPEGAALTGDVVDALAGPLAPGQYAQAGAPQSANQAIGRVEKVEGNATVVRNGVTITLNTGDVIQKGDVAQTGSGGSLAIVFSDGTAFNLAANARMVLNDFVYSAGGSNNSALISLVQGSISFVAGQVAKTGDMRVETPVATMGIRGTAVLVEISADNGATKFSVMVEPNGTVGSFNLYDKASGALLATVNSSNIGWVVTPVGPLQVLAQQVQKTPAELARELAIMGQFNFNNLVPFDPNAPQDPQPPSDPNRRGDNTNPQNSPGGGTPGGTPIDPIKVTVTPLTPPGTGNNTNTNNNNSDNPPPGTPGTGNPDTPPGGTPTQTASGDGYNHINGTEGDDDGIAHIELVGTSLNDYVSGGGGNDIIIAGHGGGDDIYDGGAGTDTIKFLSANGVTFQLNSFFENGVWKSRAQSDTTGSDQFFNIEKIVASPGDDVFVLHHNVGPLKIDAGGGFDIVKLLDDVDVHANDGFNVSNFEMIDLTSVIEDGRPNTSTGNTIELEGEGVMDANVDGKLRVLGDSNDTVKLLSDFDGNVGHWEFASDGHRSDAQLFTLGDHYSDGVTFNTYVFVSDSCGEDAGEILATAYIDEDVKVVMSAPEALVEQGAVGDGTDETTVKLARGSVEYDDTGWSHVSREGTHEYNGHYYQYVHQSGLSWGAAQAAALAAGGYLANVTSQGENDFLTNLIDYAHGGYTAYLGATDTTNEGTFVWQNGPEAGQAVNDGFHFWAPDEPNDGGGWGEDYLIMVAGPGDNEGGRWNDVNGGARGYLIEYDSNETSVLTKAGTYGYVSLDTETNELTYHLNDNDADTQALADGQTAHDFFAIVVDENGTLVTHNVDFTIHGSNDAPEVFGDVNDEQATAGTEFSFSFGANVFKDVDTGDSLTYSAKILGEAGYENLPAWLHFDSATRTFSGTPPEGQEGDYNIKVIATDVHGASVSETFTLTVDAPANAAPEISWSPEETHTPEDTPLLINGMSFGDVDAGLNEQFTVTFKVLHGSIAPAFNLEHSGLTQVPIQGDNNDHETSLPYQWRFTGSLADINAALAAGGGHGFNYAPESGYVGNEAQFTFTVTDSHGASDTQTLDISVDAPPPENEAPVIHTDAAYTYGGGDNPGDSTILAGLFVTDAEAEENPAEQYTITATAQHGTLALNDGNDAQLEISFTAAFNAVNNALDQGITYTNGTDHLETTDDDNDTVTLTVTDGNDSDTVNFQFKVFGEGGVTLTGDDGKDVLFGTGHSDDLTGGAGADTFVFAHESSPPGSPVVQDVVNDFASGADKIMLNDFSTVPLSPGFTETEFNEWKATAFETQDGNTLIHLSGTEDLLVKNVVAASLTANDFIVHPGTL